MAPICKNVTRSGEDDHGQTPQLARQVYSGKRGPKSSNELKSVGQSQQSK